MTEPRRPEPVRGVRARIAERFGNWRASRFDRIADPDDAGPGDDGPRLEDRPVFAVTATAVATAAFTLAVLWGWQVWSARSAAPIDGRLPLLVAASPAEATATPKSAVDPGPASGTAEPASEAAPTVEPTTPEVAVEHIIHVSGAVIEPGIVRLPEGARVHDAIDAAGGVDAAADLDRLNLAAPVIDGERVHVPRVGEPEPELVLPIRPSPVAGSAAPEPTVPSFIDLNRAGLDELETLPGVGPATAQAIIDTRERRGPYYTIDDLLEVDGIGPAKLEELRPHVWVQSS